MTDYNKQTVAALRQLLKDRGIPSTGLQRKAQIVEKLQETDAAEHSALDANNTVANVVGKVEEVQQEEAAEQELDVSIPAVSEADVKFDPAPATTSKPIVETKPHVDNDVPPQESIHEAEHLVDAGALDEKPSELQSDNVISAPPAGPEEAVGPTVTESTDARIEDDKKQELAQNGLPDAPGPAVKALRYAQHEPALPKVEGSISSPLPDKQPSVEKSELPTIPERSTAETSRLNTEELEADTKKRKRRSASPEFPTQDVQAKKHRPSHDFVPEVHLKEDEDVVMEQRRPSEVDAGENGSNGSNGNHITPEEPDSSIVGSDTKREKKENVSRYKDLLKPIEITSIEEAAADERSAVPALHSATPALYIRNFMRPLRPEQIRAHLVSIANPPSSSPDTSVVKSLFLDAMKTHALVLFSNTTAATRARSSLHGSTWPREANRKELWADFIPEDKVEDWIKEETDAITAEKQARVDGRPVPAKRFEVVYPESNDRSIVAVFQEVGACAPANAPRGPRASIDVRRPSAQHQPPTPSTSTAPSRDTRQDIEASFKTLDELFSSTLAKPQLFYLPVSDEISVARLKEFNHETSRDWAPGEIRKGRGIQPEARYKYSFDDEGRIVEVGDDRGPWSESYGGRGRGGGGYRGRGRGGGGYRGRGGDTWRG